MRTPSGALAGLLGPILGIGPGAGMSLLMLLTGAACILVGVTGYFVPAIREAEGLLPDHEAIPPAEAAQAG